MTLREVLHAHIPTLTSESTLRDAIDKMDIYQFPALVIVNNQNHPTHVITEGDVARAVSARGNLTSLRDEKATRFASPKPTTMTPNTEISDALHAMLQSGLTILPVTDQQILVGICLRVDLMHALLIE